MNRNVFLSRERSKRTWGILFVLPSFTFIFLFMIYPLLHSFYLSFTRYNFVYDNAPKFVGLRNYVEVFKDTEFVLSIKNTIIFSIGFFIFLMVISLSIALMLFFKSRFSWLFRSSIFMPIVIPISFACILFSWIFNEKFGLLNYFIGGVLNQPQWTHGWLTESNTAMGSMISVTLWSAIGFQTILFLSGLQAISEDILEAATIDGATGWKKIVYIILPNLRETYVITGIWGIMRALKVFVQPMVLTGGGPGNATLSMYMHIYHTAFIYFDMGKAATMAFILSAIILIFSILNIKLSTGKG